MKTITVTNEDWAAQADSREGLSAKLLELTGETITLVASTPAITWSEYPYKSGVKPPIVQNLPVPADMDAAWSQPSVLMFEVDDNFDEATIGAKLAQAKTFYDSERGTQKTKRNQDKANALINALKDADTADLQALASALQPYLP